MKLINYILLFCSLNAFSYSNDSLFTIGNYLYENEEYEKAIECYLTIDSTEHAQALYHNLGNCYYQIGNIPKSILFYERALLIKKDFETQANLELSKKRIEEIESFPTLFFISWWNSIAQYLEPKLWIILTTIFVWISCLLLLVFIKNRQKGTFNHFILAFIFTILLLFISQRSNYLNKKTYAVIMKKTKLLSNISDIEEKQIITAGNKVEVINSSKDFLLVIIPNGEIGWMAQSDLEEM